MAPPEIPERAVRRIGGALGTCFMLSIVPASAQDYPAGLYAEITTSKGLIVASLDFERAPMTVASFVGLAEGTIENDAFAPGAPFFDGSVFDRVVPGHVIQGGRAASEISGGAGYRIPNEIHAELDHGRAGMLAMANGGPHTGSNIFYITLGDRSYLDGDYTVFGQVHEGLDVVMSIVQGDVMQSVRIVRVGNGAERIRPTTGEFQRMVEGVEQDVQRAADERARMEADYVLGRWPGARSTDDGWRYVVELGGGGETVVPGQSVVLRYLGHTPQGKEFSSVNESCAPGWRSSRSSGGVSCDYVVGTTVTTPGLDAAISRMSVGDRWTVIVPSELGYGTGGHYAPDRPGERRFHISPNTMLIYEVEMFGASDGESQEVCGEVTLGTQELFRCVRGVGSPTVVLAAGAGLASPTWDPLVAALTGRTTVVTFDRAGLGRSAPGPLPRTPTRIARELIELLDRTEAPQPYVLVGHSAGGLHMLRVAEMIPQRVRAVILLDTPPPGFEDARMELLSTEEREERARVLAAGVEGRPAVVGHEREGIASEADVGHDDFQSAIPLITVVANGQDFGTLGDAAAHRALWVSMSRAFGDLSMASRFVVAEGSGHMIHRERLELVRDLILEVLGADPSGG